MARQDPFRDVYLRRLAMALARKALSMQVDPVALCLSMVQGMTGLKNKKRQNWPTESFLNQQVDCSDASVALASLIDVYQRRRRQPRYWCFLLGEGHMAVGLRNFDWADDGRVAIRDRMRRKSWSTTTRYSGKFYRGDGFRFYVCETTIPLKSIGDGESIGRARIVLPHRFDG